MSTTDVMLKEFHDQMLAAKPDGANHDPAECPICNGAASHTDPEGGSVKTYTEEEMATILAQVSDLEAKVQELEGARAESEVEAKIAEAKAEFDAKVAELQAELDKSVLEAQTAKDEKDAILNFLATAEEDAKKAEEMAALREDRIAKVKEVASFPDDYVTANADRWAAMDEETFAASLDDWKAIASKSDSETAPPAATALRASREDQPASSPMREVMDLRFKGVDARTIRS